MHIISDDLTGHAIRSLLEEHLRDMHARPYLGPDDGLAVRLAAQ